jgi:hypothetical protein
MVQDAVRASGPSWTGVENLSPGIGSPDRSVYGTGRCAGLSTELDRCGKFVSTGIGSPHRSVRSESISRPAVRLTTPKGITCHMLDQSRGLRSGILLVVNNIMGPFDILTWL